MKKTTSNNETVQRQLRFPIKVYQDSEDVMTSENRRRGLVTRGEKMYIQDILPVLVEDGIKHRAGEIFVPYGVTLTEEQNDLLAGANAAVKKFNNSISKL